MSQPASVKGFLGICRSRRAVHRAFRGSPAPPSAANAAASSIRIEGCFAASGKVNESFIEQSILRVNFTLKANEAFSQWRPPAMTPTARDDSRPVDLVHLNRYTGGDPRLNAEILGLFDRQCQEMLVCLERLSKDAPDAKAWKEITHSLKGAARGVGAFALANAAAAAEPICHDRALVIAAVQQIRDHSAAVQHFIEEFLRRAG
jgi:HPt (histidine-containing phosphotransfer) domain-containing protein